jgi:hypothetical protein
MSEENVDHFLEVADAFNQGDWRRWFACFDPGVRFEPQQATLQGSYEGHDGIRNWLDDVVEHYEPPWNLHLVDVREGLRRHRPSPRSRRPRGIAATAA